MTATQDGEKPILLFCAIPASGHTYPPLQIAGYLAKRGFKIYFIAGEQFKAHITPLGIEWRKAQLNIPPERFAQQWEYSSGPERLAFQMKHFFLDNTVRNYEILRAVMEEVRETHPQREVVLVHESLYMGLLPMYYRAPLPRGYDKLPKVVNFHTSVCWLDSVDTAPNPLGYPPPRSEADRIKYRGVYEEASPYRNDVVDYANGIYKSMGATETMIGSLNDHILTDHDITVFPCSATLEYPRREQPDNLVFIGGLPIKDTDPSFEVPTWWEEIKANAGLPLDDVNRKKLVFVTQGTNMSNYHQLLIPTMRALANDKNVLVIATLGSKGAGHLEVEGGAFPSDVQIPDNARVIDYIPYDAVLPLMDVLVSNAGYGGFMHGVMNGVPMVLAGRGADKAEVSARGEWSGIAVNLGTNEPSVEMVGEGVSRVLGDTRYRERAMELKMENEGMDSLGRIEEIILKLSGAA